MSKHQDQKIKMARRRHSHNAVRITYYVESPDVRSHHKIKPHPFSRKPQTTRTCGYDRRAELLAYANHLREADPETVYWSRKFQSSKPKVSFYPFCKYMRNAHKWVHAYVMKLKKENAMNRNGNGLLRQLESALYFIRFSREREDGGSMSGWYRKRKSVAGRRILQGEAFLYFA